MISLRSLCSTISCAPVDNFFLRLHLRGNEALTLFGEEKLVRGPLLGGKLPSADGAGDDPSLRSLQARALLINPAGWKSGRQLQPWREQPIRTESADQTVSRGGIHQKKSQSLTASFPPEGMLLNRIGRCSPQDRSASVLDWYCRYMQCSKHPWPLCCPSCWVLIWCGDGQSRMASCGRRYPNGRTACKSLTKIIIASPPPLLPLLNSPGPNKDIKYYGDCWQ